MKKIIHSVFFIVAAALLLSSCSSQLSTVSITKRHYRSGYYVDMGGSKHHTETAQKTKTSVIETTPVDQEVAVNSVPETVTPTPATTIDKIVVPKHKRNTSKEATASASKHSASVNLLQTITPNTLAELKNIKAIGRSIAAENTHHNNNNGSLIWTIIIILLILWLISVLTGGWGLGGLIYLLLVIALVLLLLKLLGII